MIQKFNMGMYRRIATFLTFIVIATGFGALSGCSTARLAYSNAESLSYWWLDGYVDFDAEQSSSVKNDLAIWFDWHRKTQLPDYVQLLESIEKRLQRPATLAEIEADAAAFRLRYRRMVERAAPALADVALSLQPTQQTRLQEKFASNNEKYRKDNLRGSLEDRQRRRFKKLMEQAEYWFGNLSPEQEAQLRTASDARPLNPELVLADRMQRQTNIIALLNRIRTEKIGRVAAIDLIEKTMEVERRYATPERQAFFAAQQAANLRLMVMMVNMANDTQRTHAVKRVQQWIVDLNRLSNAG